MGVGSLNKIIMDNFKAMFQYTTNTDNSILLIMNRNRKGGDLGDPGLQKF